MYWNSKNVSIMTTRMTCVIMDRINWMCWTISHFFLFQCLTIQEALVQAKKCKEILNTYEPADLSGVLVSLLFCAKKICDIEILYYAFHHYQSAPNDRKCRCCSLTGKKSSIFWHSWSLFFINTTQNVN